MDHESLYNLLKQLNIPVAYDHFKSNKNIIPPFLTYREQSPENFKADNNVYLKFLNFELELITVKKDTKLEKTIEELLTKNNLVYEKPDEIWDSQEEIYHIFYEI